MVMERGHFEDAFSGELEGSDLQDHREGFEDEDAANGQQQNFLLDDDRDGADASADGERAYIAHEKLGGMRVVPKEAESGAHHGAAENGELADVGDALNFKIFGEARVAGNVSEDGESTGGNERAADGQAVEAVREIDGVGRADDYEN